MSGYANPIATVVALIIDALEHMATSAVTIPAALTGNWSLGPFPYDIRAEKLLGYFARVLSFLPGAAWGELGRLVTDSPALSGLMRSEVLAIRARHHLLPGNHRFMHTAVAMHNHATAQCDVVKFTFLYALGFFGQIEPRLVGGWLRAHDRHRGIAMLAAAVRLVHYDLARVASVSSPRVPDRAGLSNFVRALDDRLARPAPELFEVMLRAIDQGLVFSHEALLDVLFQEGGATLDDFGPVLLRWRSDDDEYYGEHRAELRRAVLARASVHDLTWYVRAMPGCVTWEFLLDFAAASGLWTYFRVRNTFWELERDIDGGSLLDVAAAAHSPANGAVIEGFLRHHGYESPAERAAEQERLAAAIPGTESMLADLFSDRRTWMHVQGYLDEQPPFYADRHEALAVMRYCVLTEGIHVLFHLLVRQRWDTDGLNPLVWFAAFGRFADIPRVLECMRIGGYPVQDSLEDEVDPVLGSYATWRWLHDRPVRREADGSLPPRRLMRYIRSRVGISAGALLRCVLYEIRRACVDEFRELATHPYMEYDCSNAAVVLFGCGFGHLASLLLASGMVCALPLDATVDWICAEDFEHTDDARASLERMVEVKARIPGPLVHLPRERDVFGLTVDLRDVRALEAKYPRVARLFYALDMYDAHLGISGQEAVQEILREDLHEGVRILRILRRRPNWFPNIGSFHSLMHILVNYDPQGDGAAIREYFMGSIHEFRPEQAVEYVRLFTPGPGVKRAFNAVIAEHRRQVEALGPGPLEDGERRFVDPYTVEFFDVPDDDEPIAARTRSRKRARPREEPGAGPENKRSRRG